MIATLIESPRQSVEVVSLPALADQINHEHAAAETAARSAIAHALQAGRLLIEAKAQLRHGEFLPWLAQNCRVSDRQVRNYMRLAENWQAIEAKSEPGADLTVKGALRLLEDSTPADPWERVEYYLGQMQSAYRQIEEVLKDIRGDWRLPAVTDEESFRAAWCAIQDFERDAMRRLLESQAKSLDAEQRFHAAVRTALATGKEPEGYRQEIIRYIVEPLSQDNLGEMTRRADEIIRACNKRVAELQSA